MGSHGPQGIEADRIHPRGGLLNGLHDASSFPGPPLKGLGTAGHCVFTQDCAYAAWASQPPCGRQPELLHLGGPPAEHQYHLSLGFLICKMGPISTYLWGWLS